MREILGAKFGLFWTPEAEDDGNMHGQMVLAKITNVTPEVIQGKRLTLNFQKLAKPLVFCRVTCGTRWRLICGLFTTRSMTCSDLKKGPSALKMDQLKLPR